MKKYIVNIDRLDIEAVAVLLHALNAEYGSDYSKQVVQISQELDDEEIEIEVINYEILDADKMSRHNKPGLKYKYTRNYIMNAIEY